MTTRNRMNCTRCGKLHGGLCFAFKATCNKCLKLGHYARVCRSTTENRQKSSRTKQRDNDRMTSFLRKKLFQCHLPFYCVDNEYLKLNETNTTTLNNDVTFWKKNCADMKSQIASRTLENVNLNKKIQNLENKLTLKCYSFNEQESKLNVAINHNLSLEKENENLKAENKKLSEMQSTTDRKLKETSELLETLKTSQPNHCSKDTVTTLIDSFKEDTGFYNALKVFFEDINNELTMEFAEDMAGYVKALIHVKNCQTISIKNLKTRLSELENTNDDLVDKLERYENQLKQCKNDRSDFNLKAKVLKLESNNKDLVEKLKHFQNQQDQRPRIHRSQQDDRHYGGPRSHTDNQHRGYNSRYNGRRN